MPLVPVSVDVPPEIYAGLLTGKYTRIGSVVREGGKIVKHLDEAHIPEQVSSSSEFRGVSLLKDVFTRKNVLIGIGVVAVTAAVGTLTYYTVKSHLDKKNAEIEIPKCVAEFNNSFCEYLDAIQSGKLDVNIVNRLISDLDEINENYSVGNIKIDFSTERLNSLMNLVSDYTQKFAGANSYEYNALEVTDIEPEDGTLINLRHYLEIQKQVFERAAS